MKNEKQKEIKHKVIGKTFVAVIERKNYPFTGDVAARKLIKTEIERYNKLNTDDRLEKIKKLLAPKAEKIKTDLVIQKKKIKHEQKKLQQDVAEEKKDNKPLEDALTAVKQLTETTTKQAQEIEDLKKLVEQSKKVAEKPVQASTPRSGEY